MNYLKSSNCAMLAPTRLGPASRRASEFNMSVRVAGKMVGPGGGRCIREGNYFSRDGDGREDALPPFPCICRSHSEFFEYPERKCSGTERDCHCPNPSGWESWFGPQPAFQRFSATRSSQKRKCIITDSSVSLLTNLISIKRDVLPSLNFFSPEYSSTVTWSNEVVCKSMIDVLVSYYFKRSVLKRRKEERE